MNMKATISLLLMLLSLGLAWGQREGLTVLSGKVRSEGRAVPYATLQLQGNPIGVSCNDAGEYVLKLSEGHEHDTVIVRSLGYIAEKVTVARLRKKGDVQLRRQPIELRTVAISDFRTARHLMRAMISRIAENYHQQRAWSTFFYRDWRTVDGELYLFDEAVMNVERCAYSQYADKHGYRLDPREREMESNLKRLLRHRLVVCDRRLLEGKILKPEGRDEMLVYSDNEVLFDPVATPQASYALASRMLKEHWFEPIKTFSADGEDYYLVRSVGPGRTPRAHIRYEYTIRKSDLALVRLVSSNHAQRSRAPKEAWVNWFYDSMTVESDSSVWDYAVCEGHYTLTHYFNDKVFNLRSYRQQHADEVQRWHHRIEWVLTDFSLTPLGAADTVAASTLPPSPQLLPGAFGSSDYDADFWGHYNTIPIDSLPLQLLREKFHIQ